MVTGWFGRVFYFEEDLAETFEGGSMDGTYVHIFTSGMFNYFPPTEAVESKNRSINYGEHSQ